MKNIELLNWLTDQEKEILELGAKMHKAGRSGIRFTIKNADEKKVTLVVIQKKLYSRQFTSKELYEEGKRLFRDIALNSRRLYINTITYQDEDLTNFGLNQINDFILNSGIPQRTICSGLGIDEVTMSNVLNGKMALNKWKKSAFYYYFKWLESQERCVKD